MICQVRDNGKEVALSNVKVGDILALINVLFHKDKEVVFTNPESEVKDDERD